MGAGILAVVGNPVLSGVISSLVSNLFGSDSLEVFLHILSKDFSARVENAIRAAFTEQNLLEIKINIINASNNLRQYKILAETNKPDENKESVKLLAQSSQNIQSACARILSVSQSLIEKHARKPTPGFLGLLYSYNNNPAKIKDNSERGNQVNAHLSQIEACINALKTAVAMDLLVMAARVKHYPSLNIEAVERINEYLDIAAKLRSAYINRHGFRVWINEEVTSTYKSPVVRNFSDPFSEVEITKFELYKDGSLLRSEYTNRVIKTSNSAMLKHGENELKKMRDKYSEAYNNEMRPLKENAERKMSVGNDCLDYAIANWEKVKSIASSNIKSEPNQASKITLSH